MRNLENMLKNKAIECNKLVEYGFKKQENNMKIRDLKTLFSCLKSLFIFILW